VAYGPRPSAVIIELAGIAGNSRRMVQGFCLKCSPIPGQRITHYLLSVF